MAGIIWSAPPKNLVLALKKYERDVLVAVLAVARYHGQAMQDSARRAAPWEDRTGNARGGLFYAVEMAGYPAVVGQVTGDAPKAPSGSVTVEAAAPGTCVVWLSHTMYYGIFLELANGGKYAVVMSTIEKHLPALMASLQALVK